MTNESGRAISLVILGIVAVIAIVGLVLLFTGAKNAAVGEFAVPAAKVYGGAIQEIWNPYSRQFAGKAVELGENDYYSGVVGEYSSGSYPQYQDIGKEGSVLGTSGQPEATYHNAINQIATILGGSCGILTRSGMFPYGEYPVESSWQQAQAAMANGLQCVTHIRDMNGDVASVAYLNGNNACCKSQSV